MKLSILHKLVLAIVGLTLVVLIATLGLARWSFERGFLDYVNAIELVRLEQLAENLEQDYVSGGNSWVGLSNRTFKHRLRELKMGGAFSRPPRNEERLLREGHGSERDRKPPRRPRVFSPPTGLFNVEGVQIAGPTFEPSASNIVVPVEFSGVRVGELRSVPYRAIESPQGTQFSRQQLQTSILIGVVALLLAGLVALLLARVFLAPLRKVISSMNRLASGDYATRIVSSRSDEFGLLARDFDRLALSLDKNQTARKRWLADISHELRTPLTILHGELEALKDGVRTFNSQQLISFDQEVERLRLLVNDLYELSVSDIGGLRYSFDSVSLSDCLLLSIEAMASEADKAGITLSVTDDTKVTFNADRSRLEQLFRNLIRNSLAYTDAPGEIEVSVAQKNGMAVIEVQDTAPGATEEECKLLFDPLYRQEQSRNRCSAGAGLGLSICKNIVEAHRGVIRAAPSPLGGLIITIELPLD